MNRTFVSSKKIFASLTVLATVIMPYATSVPVASAAPAPFFVEDFGVGSSDMTNIPDWSEHEDGTIAKAPVTSPLPNNDSASPDGGMFAKIAEDSGDPQSVDGWICRVIDAREFTDLEISYYWRGDSDAGSGDVGRVQVKAGSDDAACNANSSSWDEVSAEDLGGDDGWISRTAVAIPDKYEDSRFLLRFYNESNDDNEYFRVDGIEILGVEKPKPDLKVTKTSDVDVVQPGESFTWTILIENRGTVDAEFGKYAPVFKDNMPGDDIHPDEIGNYGEAVVRYTDVSGVYCWNEDGSQDDRENLYCRAGKDGATIKAGGSIEITVEANLNPVAGLGAIRNPRASSHRYDDPICRVDPDNKVAESDESPESNDCSDTVYIGYEPATITVVKVTDGALQETDQFDFELRDGQTVLGTDSIVAPAPLATISFDVAFTSEDPRSVTLSETAMPLSWLFQAVTCLLDDAEVQPVYAYDGQNATLLVSPGDEVTCTFVDRRRGGGSQQYYGTLVLEKYIRSDVSSSFDDFRYDVDGALFGSSGHFDESGRNTFDNVPVGPYYVYEDADGYGTTYGGACDEAGLVTVVKDESITCTVTNTADGWEEGDGQQGPQPTDTSEPEPTDEGGVGGYNPESATLIVEKVIRNEGHDDAVFTDFSFSVDGESYAFEADGANGIELVAGDYTVTENPAEGYLPEYSGDCDADGSISIASGEKYTCRILNTYTGDGYNPETDSYPTPTPPPGGGPRTGGPSNDALGGPETDASPVPSPASPSRDVNLQTAAAGGILGLDLCSTSGHWLWWITLLVLAAVLLWFGRRKGTYVWLIALYALIWFLWAWKFCMFGYDWLPVLLAVIIWLLSVPRGGTDDEAAKQGSSGRTK